MLPGHCRPLALEPTSPLAIRLYFHGNTSACASSVAPLSLADTIGAPLIGQSIASAGSLHGIER